MGGRSEAEAEEELRRRRKVRIYESWSRLRVVNDEPVKPRSSQRRCGACVDADVRDAESNFFLAPQETRMPPSQTFTIKRIFAYTIARPRGRVTY